MKHRTTAAKRCPQTGSDEGLEFAQPVNIGRDVWVGGAVIICPGVTVGDRAVIGAGSVVTRDVPPGVFAAGNPCRVIRELQRSKVFRLSGYRSGIAPPKKNAPRFRGALENDA